MIYRSFRSEIAWRDVWVGAAITALLFTIGQVRHRLYLGHRARPRCSGRRARCVICYWIYYSTQICSSARS